MLASDLAWDSQMTWAPQRQRTASLIATLRRSGLTVVAIALALGWAAGARAQTCSKPPVDVLAMQARKDQAALQTALASAQDLNPHLSSATAKRIEEAKRALIALADGYMACAPPDRAAAAIEGDLTRLLGVAGPTDAGPRFRVRRWEAGVIGVVADVPIPCGDDAMLLVFAPKQGRWREALRWRSAPYRRVSDAFGSFDYAISPLDVEGRWYAVAKAVAPWCASTWSSVGYAVLRPGPTETRPYLLYTTHDPIWTGRDDDHGVLWVRPDEFELRFRGASIDSNIQSRTWIRHFAVDGDEVRRIPPIALSPRDFVDEWIVSPWPAVSGWTAADTRSQLEPVHDRLHKIGAFRFLSAHRCAGEPGHYEISLSDTYGVSYFVRVVGEGPYELRWVSQAPSQTCGGRDLLGGMQTQ
jgi:hypothetical protein